MSTNSKLINMANSVAGGFGLSIMRNNRNPALKSAKYPPDFSPADIKIMETVRRYTMTSGERIHALISAVRYIEHAEIQGDIVECGVWRGGSMMAAALTLKTTNRTLHLFDTFEGQPPPNKEDMSYTGQHASELMNVPDVRAYASYEDVEQSLSITKYPKGQIRMVCGKVEETIPASAPESIALLRLDTDWYESTKHELEHLYPRLVSGGVLIIDDYGHWQGARKAVDEYFADGKTLLHRIDYTGRMVIKR